MNKKQEPLTPKPARAKEPCRKQQIDFHLCDKKYGFNDQYCKFYLELYESCVQKNKDFYENF